MDGQGYDQRTDPANVSGRQAPTAVTGPSGVTIETRRTAMTKTQVVIIVLAPRTWWQRLTSALTVGAAQWGHSSMRANGLTPQRGFEPHDT
jgi:hypothetical protein